MKTRSIFYGFWGPFGVQNGAQNRSKIDHFSSRGSRGSQGSILEGFWTNFGAILGWFLEGFWTYINARTHCVPSACFFVLVEVVGDIAVLLPSFWIWFGVVLYVVCHDFSHAFRCLDFSFETTAIMCGDMARALVWSVVIGLVCWPVVLSALFDLVCLVWFRMLWTVCADSLVLVSSVW